MTKKWFGPILQACGCCYEEPPPPPPPPCGCDVNECLPIYADNFSRIRFQASLSDSLKWEAMSQQLQCETTCRNIIRRTEVDIEWSGFSAFNGTYEIPFYAYNDVTEVWEEADPTLVSCGVWFYPLITANVTWTRTWKRLAIPVDFYGTYNDTGCLTEYQQVTRTLRVAMETRSGEMYILDPVEPVPSVPGNVAAIGQSGGVDFIALDPAVAQKTVTQKFLECSSLGGPDNVFVDNVDARQPGIFSVVKHINPAGTIDAGGVVRPVLTVQQGMSLGAIDGNPNRPELPNLQLPIGVRWAGNQVEQPRRSGFYDSSIYPYGGPGFPQTSTQCNAVTEQVTTVIPALSLTWDDAFFIANGSSFRNQSIQCNPFYPMFTSAPYTAGPHVLPPFQFSYNAFNSDFRVLLN